MTVTNLEFVLCSYLSSAHICHSITFNEISYQVVPIHHISLKRVHRLENLGVHFLPFKFQASSPKTSERLRSNRIQVRRFSFHSHELSTIRVVDVELYGNIL